MDALKQAYQRVGRCWIHFLGKEYYSTSKFIKEARRLGVSRRVAPHVLRQMRWGDIVLLARSRKASCKIFGWFKISTLFAKGLKDLLADRLDIVWTPMNETVDKLCGRYTISACCGLSPFTRLEEVAERITKDHKAMVGGELVLLSKPVKIRGLTYIRGFRPFCLEKLIVEYEAKLPHCGQYYDSFEPLANLSIPLDHEGMGFNMEAYIKAGG